MANNHREPHDPQGEIPVYVPTAFEHAQFLGFIQSVQTAKYGGVRIVVDITGAQRHEALKLWDAIGPYPLSFDVLRWSVPDADPGPFARTEESRRPGNTPEPGT